MSAEVVALRPDAGDIASAAGRALAALHRHLDRCKLSANTVKAYKRQAATYVSWLTGPGIEHDDAFADVTVPKPGEPDALTTTEQGAVERAAARRSAPRGGDHRSPAVCRSPRGGVRTAGGRRCRDHRPHRHSACTARATKSAQSRSHRPHGPALLHGSTSAAANPACCGPASAEP
ncbi:hypothetical protein HII36_23900 [Nonomuraea sp. NN258]|uniref:hypothetical protein n=1 Tax=Nonomuraea antri TaxID=2730852 RepID=UPI00156965DC|nr:hypothetical protein [Nonomuraea antri]NRQ34853.1 hypothetical protein [Nonomuraea antri]